MLDKHTLVSQLRPLLDIAREGEFDTLFIHLNEIIKIKGLVNYYINNLGQPLDADDKIIIELVIRILQEVDNNSGMNSPVPDDEYDELYELYRTFGESDIVGASSGIGSKRSHRYPDLRGTLDKTHFVSNIEKKKKNESRKSIEDWVTMINNRAGRKLTKVELKCIMFPKWDGVSVIFENDANGDVEYALSRGDTDKNEAKDYTPLFKGRTNFKRINSFGTEFGLKTEIVMRRKDYERFCEKYGEFKSPRSAVTSILNSDDFDVAMLEYLTIIPLQIQSMETREIRIPIDAIDQYPTCPVNLMSYDDIVKGINDIKALVNFYVGVDIDGVVFRLVDTDIQALLGRDGKINKYEFAFKYPPERQKTIINDVDYSVGILGAVSPVAKIEPVRMKGNKISSVSLGSPGIFESLKLRKGDEVIIKYDVIPGLEIDETCVRSDGEAFVFPTHCPTCGTLLVEDPVIRCINLDCPSRVIGKIMNYVEKMVIANISIGKITELNKAGLLDDIRDLYRIELNKRAIGSLPGFGEKSVQKIIDGVNDRRRVYDYEFLGSLGIPSAGRRRFEKLLDVYSLKELLEFAVEDKISKIIAVAGFKETSAATILKGIRLNYELIQFLRSELEIISNDASRYRTKVTFTKVRDAEFEEYLDKVNVRTIDYSKETDMVIIPKEGITSGTVTKAMKAGKPVVTLEDAYRMFEYKKE